uniref:Uncharacterized protein n=1 Tax=Cacopsylla melanoneura TaxID=428564 RepID=A0A8D8YTS2_9HEMI
MHVKFKLYFGRIIKTDFPPAIITGLRVTIYRILTNFITPFLVFVNFSFLFFVFCFLFVTASTKLQHTFQFVKTILPLCFFRRCFFVLSSVETVSSDCFVLTLLSFTMAEGA